MLGAGFPERAIPYLDRVDRRIDMAVRCSAFAKTFAPGREVTRSSDKLIGEATLPENAPNCLPHGAQPPEGRHSPISIGRGSP
jgi:hypothetical protein